MRVPSTRNAGQGAEPGPLVEVVYALPERQAAVAMVLPPEGLTAGDAIRLSRLRERFPELDRDDLPIGVFGKTCTFDRQLEPGDRVEIYRPLRNDPRAMRRARAGKNAAQKGSGPARR